MATKIAKDERVLVPISDHTEKAITHGSKGHAK